MIRLENIKAGDYDYLEGKTFVLSNTRDVSFYIADDTPQRLKLSIRLSESESEHHSFIPDEIDDHHLRIVISCKPGENLVSKEFVRIGSFDDDLKPLYMSFYATIINDVSRVLIFNFYTLKHGEDIG